MLADVNSITFFWGSGSISISERFGNPRERAPLLGLPVIGLWIWVETSWVVIPGLWNVITEAKTGYVGSPRVSVVDDSVNVQERLPLLEKSEIAQVNKETLLTKRLRNKDISQFRSDPNCFGKVLGRIGKFISPGSIFLA